MFAIVTIAGQQFKVKEGDKLFVHRLAAQQGDTLTFSEVLLVDKDGKVQIGTPTVANAKVEAKVLDHVKGDKVIVFKKKRRKGYRVKKGHRQQFTQIEVTAIQA